MEFFSINIILPIITSIITALLTGSFLNYYLPRKLTKFQSLLQHNQWIWEWKLKKYQECIVVLDEIYQRRKQLIEYSWVDAAKSSNYDIGIDEARWEEIIKINSELELENIIKSLNSNTLLVPLNIRSSLSKVLLAYMTTTKQERSMTWDEHMMEMSDKLEEALKEQRELENLMKDDLQIN
ncbi:MAG: hypothetical protein HYZ34_01020 [Ignavibacteriae bacterium]|nr:hypothetical protein [Ignavibacteriota bacterium]